MSEPSIFSGFKLSDKLPATPTVPVDQRLFAPVAARPGPQVTPPSTDTPPSPSPQEAPTAAPEPPASSLPPVGKEGKRETGDSTGSGTFGTSIDRAGDQDDVAL
jgi:hypothetical protein